MNIQTHYGFKMRSTVGLPKPVAPQPAFGKSAAAAVNQEFNVAHSEREMKRMLEGVWRNPEDKRATVALKGDPFSGARPKIVMVAARADQLQGIPNLIPLMEFRHGRPVPQKDGIVRPDPNDDRLHVSVIPHVFADPAIRSEGTVKYAVKLALHDDEPIAPGFGYSPRRGTDHLAVYATITKIDHGKPYDEAHQRNNRFPEFRIPLPDTY